jgi:hypothetical protein
MRTFGWASWVEAEIFWLNELARKGRYYKYIEDLRIKAYGEEDTLEPLVNTWIAMLLAQVMHVHTYVSLGVRMHIYIYWLAHSLTLQLAVALSGL